MKKEKFKQIMNSKTNTSNWGVNEIINNSAMKLGYNINDQYNPSLLDTNKELLKSNSLYFVNIFEQNILIKIKDDKISFKIFVKDFNSYKEVYSNSNSYKNHSELLSKTFDLSKESLIASMKIISSSLDVKATIEDIYKLNNNPEAYYSLDIKDLNPLSISIDEYNNYIEKLSDYKNMVEEMVNGNFKKIDELFENKNISERFEIEHR